MYREPRFPGIKWYCDHCNAYLNDQPGFDDHKYIWKCCECGYKTSISLANINRGTNAFSSFLLQLLGLFSAISLHTTVMLCIAIWGFHANKKIYFPLMFVFAGVYIILLIIAIITEIHYRKNISSKKSIITICLRDIYEDLFEPIFTIKNGIAAILGKYKSFGSRISHIFWGLLFLAIFVGEVIMLSYIVHYELSDWRALLTNVFLYLKEKVTSVFNPK